MHRVAIAFVTATTLSAQAATFYVSPSGDNTNTGSSLSPWLTIQHAANTIAPGDTVVVTPGTYAGFNVTSGGLPAQYKVFSAQPGVIINTAAAGSHLARINLDTVSHVVIEGFEVVGANNSATSRDGIRVVAPLAAGARDIVLRRNHVHHNYSRNILTGFVSDLRIENNTVNNAYIEHGIYVSNSADNHIIRNNLSYANRGSGIQINADGTLGGDGIITNARIENNVIHGNGVGGGSGINLDGVQSSVIQNNLLYDNHASGISLYRIDGSAGSSGNIVANNTIINAADGRWALNIQNGSTGNTVLNNILFSLQANRGAIDIDAASLTGFVSNHNIVENRFSLDGNFMNIDNWRTQTGDDGGSVTVTDQQLTALFADFSNNNFSLAPMSLAIDRGIASLLNGTAKHAPLDDILGATRPAGAGFDIGAYEAQPIPEPSTWMMLLAGCVLVLYATSRHRRSI
jgi:parallel beta-helix repeat protein